MFSYIIFLILIALLAHPIGEAIPKRIFHADRFPFRSYDWEQDGRIYNKIGIVKWKDKIPDTSKFIKGMTPKKIECISSDEALILLRETCLAEFVHWSEILLAGIYLLIWPIPSGIWIFLIWSLLGNLPFIIVQRYNRPRLLKMYNILSARGM